MTIQNGNSRPLAYGALPNVGGAMNGLMQPMVFTVVTKTVVNFQVIETRTDVAFRGVVQPLSERLLQLKPEGQRAWTWLLVHADPSLRLTTDDVVTYQGVQTRVMALKDFSGYGYIEYHVVQDWQGVGP